MKIALVGATGFVGSAILKEALDRGHQVTAIVRHPENLTMKNKKLEVLQCDVMNTGRLAESLKGNDATVSAYNAGWDNPDIYNEYLKGSRSIQEAVKKSGLKRYLVIGGAGSLFIKPGEQLIDSPEFPKAFKEGAAAAKDYLNILKEEDELEWTLLSPAIEMNQTTPHNRSGKYRKGLDNPVFDENNQSRISVEDLAVAIIDELEDPKHIRQRFTVGY